MDYITGPGRDNDPERAKLIGGQGFGFDPKTDEDAKLAVDMMEHNARPETQASQTKKCEKDALHISLSWPRGQRAEQDEMHEAGKRFLKELGMEKAMALFYKHSDKAHEHMHMGVSMIDPKTGLTYDRYQLVYRGQHQAIKWEREKDQITPTRRHQHDIADAAGGVSDFSRLQKLLQKDEEKISHKKIDQALAYGGHFGRDMAANREAFKKYIKEEPERTREQEKEKEQADWAERLGLKSKTPEQIRGLIDMTKNQADRLQKTIDDPVDSKRHPKETLDHYAEQVRTSREGIAAAERELMRRGIPIHEPKQQPAQKERTAKIEKEIEAGRPAPDPVSEPADRWWQEPVEPGQPRKTPEPTPGRTTVQDDRKLLRDGLKAADDAKDIDRRKFVERLQRSNDQFGGLTPYMRTALGADPGRSRDLPKPAPRQPEARVTTSQVPRDKEQDDPSRAPGTGNTPDRTDQTAEGREYIKRQKSRGRER